eukprot:jgi/Botrbrau1/2443/Bobra.0226s0002.1
MFANLTGSLLGRLGQGTGEDGIPAWLRLGAQFTQAAADAVMDLPPLQEDMGFLRLSIVLAHLCHAVYTGQAADIGSSIPLEVPLAGPSSRTTVVKATLLHFREAQLEGEMSSPLQFGLWEVEGLGLVVAYRGTASPDDVFVDTNIQPVAVEGCSPSTENEQLYVHGGFYQGARRHLEEVAEVVAAHNQPDPSPGPRTRSASRGGSRGPQGTRGTSDLEQGPSGRVSKPGGTSPRPSSDSAKVARGAGASGGRGRGQSIRTANSGTLGSPQAGSLGSGAGSLPKKAVWVTGHSLGGAYASCMFLHLLASRGTAQLFGGGGGVVTFGAPMVVYSENSSALSSHLQALERFAEDAAGSRPRLHFHNWVNNADLVVRLLKAFLGACARIRGKLASLCKDLSGEGSRCDGGGPIPTPFPVSVSFSFPAPAPAARMPSCFRCFDSAALKRFCTVRMPSRRAFSLVSSFTCPAGLTARVPAALRSPAVPLLGFLELLTILLNCAPR